MTNSKKKAKEVSQELIDETIDNEPVIDIADESVGEVLITDEVEQLVDEQHLSESTDEPVLELNEAVLQLNQAVAEVEDLREAAIKEAISIEEAKPLAEVGNVEEIISGQVSLLQGYASTWTVKVTDSDKKFPGIYIEGEYPSEVFKNTVKQFIANFVGVGIYTVELFQTNGSRIKFNINTN